MVQTFFFWILRRHLAWVMVASIGTVGRTEIVWAAYKVVFKNGSVVEARTKPVSMEGQYRFTGMNGQSYSVPFDLIDTKATRSANQSGEKASSTSKKYTNEDLAGKGVSAASGEPAASPSKKDGKDGKTPLSAQTPSAPSSARGQEYWRNRARVIQDRLSTVDKQIQELQTKIREGKGEGIKVGMGTYTPYMMVGFENQLGTLEKEKAKLQSEFAALEEEARKAGALPGWLR